jgi:hypothetical protein
MGDAPACGEQQRGVDGPGAQVELLLPGAEQLQVPQPREGEGDEQRAEGAAFQRDDVPDEQIARQALRGRGNRMGMDLNLSVARLKAWAPIAPPGPAA